MTHLIETSDSFVDDALDGLVAVHGDLLRRVDGGVVRRHSQPGHVRIVTGGGSGHYPAFTGYVGPGLADAAVVGQLFASPSTAQALRVCDGLDVEAGVIFAFGNYAGDVLNFSAAAARLRAQGVPCECLAVTDDVASAPPDESDRRRGVAGDVPVLKVLGAAAEAGLPFTEVMRLGQSANDRTRSFGVAFSGVTMPGQAAPLFSLPAGTMGVGLGIHGEPGIGERPLPRVSEIASLLVERVWSERPPGDGARLGVLLNGLGATSQEELFVLWRYVRDELAARGAELVEPLVGSYVTSLDMAGCSLTVTWLDDQLEPLWCAPAETAVLRRGPDASSFSDPPGAAPSSYTDRRTTPVKGGGEKRADAAAQVPASAASVRLAAGLGRAFEVAAAALAAAEDELGALDSYAGDGDHGQGMARGSAAAAEAARQSVARGAGANEVFAAAADAWADRAGGTSGALWGLGLRGAEEVLDPDAPDPVACARAALAAVQESGGATPGDKTLVDALEPFVSTLEQERDQPLGWAWRAAAARAERAAAETAGLRPRLGRARPLAERSLGHPDPGAVSLALVVARVASVLDADPDPHPSVPTARSNRPDQES